MLLPSILLLFRALEDLVFHLGFSGKSIFLIGSKPKST